MSSVSFQNADSKPDLKEKNRLTHFIKTVFHQHGKNLQSLMFVFCSDEYLLTLNRQFLKHDYYTDILTFDLSEGEAITGEIYISIDRVKENASQHNVFFQQELLRIIFHGVLHLCGFSDKTTLQKKKMTLLENKTLEDFAKFHVKQE